MPSPSRPHNAPTDTKPREKGSDRNHQRSPQAIASDVSTDTRRARRRRQREKDKERDERLEMEKGAKFDLSRFSSIKPIFLPRSQYSVKAASMPSKQWTAPLLSGADMLLGMDKLTLVQSLQLINTAHFHILSREGREGTLQDRYHETTSDRQCSFPEVIILTPNVETTRLMNNACFKLANTGLFPKGWFYGHIHDGIVNEAEFNAVKTHCKKPRIFIGVPSTMTQLLAKNLLSATNASMVVLYHGSYLLSSAEQAHVHKITEYSHPRRQVLMLGSAYSREAKEKAIDLLAVNPYTTVVPMMPSEQNSPSVLAELKDVADQVMKMKKEKLPDNIDTIPELVTSANRVQKGELLILSPPGYPSDINRILGDFTNISRMLGSAGHTHPVVLITPTTTATTTTTTTTTHDGTKTNQAKRNSLYFQHMRGISESNLRHAIVCLLVKSAKELVIQAVGKKGTITDRAKQCLTDIVMHPSVKPRCESAIVTFVDPSVAEFVLDQAAKTPNFFQRGSEITGWKCSYWRRD